MEGNFNPHHHFAVPRPQGRNRCSATDECKFSSCGGVPARGRWLEHSFLFSYSLTTPPCRPSPPQEGNFNPHHHFAVPRPQGRNRCSATDGCKFSSVGGVPARGRWLESMFLLSIFSYHPAVPALPSNGGELFTTLIRTRRFGMCRCLSSRLRMPMYIRMRTLIQMRMNPDISNMMTVRFRNRNIQSATFDTNNICLCPMHQSPNLFSGCLLCH